MISNFNDIGIDKIPKTDLDSGGNLEKCYIPIVKKRSIKSIIYLQYCIKRPSKSKIVMPTIA